MEKKKRGGGRGGFPREEENGRDTFLIRPKKRGWSVAQFEIGRV